MATRFEKHTRVEKHLQSMHFEGMEATLTDLRRQVRRLLRAATTGQEVIITEHGRPVARLVPCIPVRVFEDPDRARDGTLATGAILEALDDARTQMAEHIAVRV